MAGVPVNQMAALLQVPTVTNCAIIRPLALRHALPAALLLCGAAAASRPVRQTAAKQAAELISARCINCHDIVKRSGGLDLSSRTAAIAVLSPTKPDQSRVMRMVASGKMPPNGK